MLWARHSDRTGERTWHVVIAVPAGGSRPRACRAGDGACRGARRADAGQYRHQLVQAAAVEHADAVPVRTGRRGGHRHHQFDRQSRRLCRSGHDRLDQGPDRQLCRRPLFRLRTVADVGGSDLACCRVRRHAKPAPVPVQSQSQLFSQPEDLHAHPFDRSHSRRRHRPRSHLGRHSRAGGAGQAGRRSQLQYRDLRLGLGLLQEARRDDAGRWARTSSRSSTPSISARSARPTCPITSRCGACACRSARASTNTPMCARPRSCRASPRRCAMSASAISTG